MSLENAPDEVKLAVDLIMLLENHDIPAETVLKALEIVQRDFEGKVKASSLQPNPLPQGEGK
ncbi:TPA: pleiotropic regulatory protein RsmS [Enterobacter kobei]|nr:pleiotropic regulatory protein RsmS [Enterobacter kobei]HCR5052541.1 pleiotropic regulatory protein RsmS [Enterobacter kobei]